MRNFILTFFYFFSGAGFNPNWNQTVFCTLHMPEIALIRFAVWDEDPIGRDYIGQATFSVRSLLPGKVKLQVCTRLSLKGRRGVLGGGGGLI